MRQDFGIVRLQEFLDGLLKGAIGVSLVLLMLNQLLELLSRGGGPRAMGWIRRGRRMGDAEKEERTPARSLHNAEKEDRTFATCSA